MRPALIWTSQAERMRLGKLEKSPAGREPRNRVTARSGISGDEHEADEAAGHQSSGGEGKGHVVTSRSCSTTLTPTAPQMLVRIAHASTLVAGAMSDKSGGDPGADRAAGEAPQSVRFKVSAVWRRPSFLLGVAARHAVVLTVIRRFCADSASLVRGRAQTR